MDKTVEVSQAARDAAEEPFAHFQWNESWGVWEQVRPECASDPNVVAAYRLPTTRATQPEAALREAEAKLEFTRGYLLAVANIVHTHDEDVIATDVLAELGEKEGAIKRCGFDDYDAKPLRKLFREIGRRNAYCRARAALKDHRHG